MQARSTDVFIGETAHHLANAIAVELLARILRDERLRVWTAVPVVVEQVVVVLEPVTAQDAVVLA